LSAVALYTSDKVFMTVGNVIMFAGIIAGLVIIFSAMIKYNKGIF